MNSESIAFSGAILIVITASFILIINDWRAIVSLLAVQFLGTFIMIGQEWPLAMSLSHLVAGWIAGAVLGMAMLSLPSQARMTEDTEQVSEGKNRYARRFHLSSGQAPNIIFIMLAIFVVSLAVFSQIPQLSIWLPGLSLIHSWGGLILIGLALLHLGFYSEPLRVTVGLLTLFSGFLILYAAVNITTLTAALSATITLGIALSGAYLFLAPHMEPGE